MGSIIKQFIWFSQFIRLQNLDKNFGIQRFYLFERTNLHWDDMPHVLTGTVKRAESDRDAEKALQITNENGF